MNITKKDLKHIIKDEILKASKDLGLEDQNGDIDVNDLNKKINKLVGENHGVFKSINDLSSTFIAIQERLEKVQLEIEECKTQVEDANNTQEDK
tara:strand:+ start:217 stop:498 length:282 start_codon:yes stop_codon:yes gene_type:complete